MTRAEHRPDRDAANRALRTAHEIVDLLNDAKHRRQEPAWIAESLRRLRVELSARLEVVEAEIARL